jgi:hypothetical protein
VGHAQFCFGFLCPISIGGHQSQSAEIVISGQNAAPLELCNVSGWPFGRRFIFRSPMERCAIWQRLCHLVTEAINSGCSNHFPLRHKDAKHIQHDPV